MQPDVSDVAGAPDVAGGPWKIALHTEPYNPALRYIMVRVGHGKQVPVLVDTGSSGLRIFANAVGKRVAKFPWPILANFHGSEWQGQLAYGTVSIGNHHVPGRVYFHLVTSVYCEKTKPSCGAAGGIANYESKGFYGIFGINEGALGYPEVWMSPSPAVSSTPPASEPGKIVYSVIPQLPAPLRYGYILAFSRGTLQIGLNLPGDRNGFNVARVRKALHPNGTNAFAQTHFGTCWQIAGYTPVTSCWYSGPDSGGGTSIMWNSPRPSGFVFSNGAFDAGVPVSVWFSDVVPSFVWNFETGRKPGNDAITFGNATCAHMDLATDPYHSFDFIYDTKDLLLGVRARKGTQTSQPSPQPTPSYVTCTPTPSPT